MDAELVAELHKGAFPVAYRMLGSAAEAEDLVQEALLRLQAAIRQGTSIANPHGFLITTTTRLAIDHLKSARVKREVYPGEWLPEPIVQQQGSLITDKVEMAESLSFAFLVLMEALSPIERPVFLLRQIFDYDYEEIAGVVGKSEANCRQAFSRAKKHIVAKRPRFEPSREKREALAKQFFATCVDGSLADLEALLAADVEFHGDGGGIASAVQHAVVGSVPVSRLMLGIFRRATQYGLHYSETVVNGQPGLWFQDGEGGVISVMSVHVVDGKVGAIYSVINPDKLQHLGEVSSLAEFRRSRPC